MPSIHNPALHHVAKDVRLAGRQLLAILLNLCPDMRTRHFCRSSTVQLQNFSQQPIASCGNFFGGDGTQNSSPETKANETVHPLPGTEPSGSGRNYHTDRFFCRCTCEAFDETRHKVTSCASACIDKSCGRYVL